MRFGYFIFTTTSHELKKMVNILISLLRLFHTNVRKQRSQYTLWLIMNKLDRSMLISLLIRKNNWRMKWRLKEKYVLLLHLTLSNLWDLAKQKMISKICWSNFILEMIIRFIPLKHLYFQKLGHSNRRVEIKLIRFWRDTITCWVEWWSMTWSVL